MTIDDFIVTVAENNLKYQRKDGSFPGGHNGPYYDDDTPVRNSGHWLITLSKCYKLTGKRIYKERVADIAEFLSSGKARPDGYTFHHRNPERKNRCNSLIGQAWTIEALMEAYSLLNDNKHREIAEEVFLLHPFLEEYGLWRRMEIDGTLLSVDRTFNHQLWFAACSSIIDKSNIIRDRVITFLDNISKNVKILENGLIFHKIQRFLPELYENRSNSKSYLLEIYRKIREDYFNRDLRVKIRRKSIGYQSFNLYAFAILKERFPGHDYWGNERFKETIDYVLTKDYKKKLKNNKYGFPYNPPGFEIPYSLQVLSGLDESKKLYLIRYWLNRQLQLNYNHKTMMMDKNTEDPLTLTSRIYELTRLNNRILNMDLISLNCDE